MWRASLAEPAALRCQVAARRQWGMGPRVWGNNGERRLLSIRSTLGPRASLPSLFKGGVRGLKAQKKGELSGEGKGAWTTTPAHRSVVWPEAPPHRHQRVAHSQRPGLERCGIRSDAPARPPGSDRAWCPAALMAEGTALEPVVEAVIAAIKVGGGMVSGEGVGEAMVLLRRALGLGGASSRRRNPSNGPVRGICSTKSVRVRPEALTARSIKP